MQRHLLLCLVLILGVVLAGSFSPLAAQEESCSPNASVESCFGVLGSQIEMALANGGIDNAGIAESLMQKLQGAYDAYMAGHHEAAMGHVMAFNNEVMAQSGKHIMEDVAMMLMMGADTLMGLLAPSPMPN